jgi:hypothetical protein
MLRLGRVALSGGDGMSDVDAADCASCIGLGSITTLILRGLLRAIRIDHGEI